MSSSSQPPPSRPPRRSYISALRSMAPNKEGPTHVGWQRLRAALRGAGIVPGLLSRSMHARLGPHARLKPTARAIFDLLDRYMREEARGRPSEGRWLAHREGDRDSARRIVARLRACVPELGPLTLADERHGGQQFLLLRTVGAHVDVAAHALEEERLGNDAGWVRRTVTVDAIVEATNRLLALRSLPIRFLPVHSPDAANAYLAVTRVAAVKLDSVDFWAEPLEDLSAFASWLGTAEQVA